MLVRNAGRRPPAFGQLRLPLRREPIARGRRSLPARLHSAMRRRRAAAKRSHRRGTPSPCASARWRAPGPALRRRGILRPRSPVPRPSRWETRLPPPTRGQCGHGRQEPLRWQAIAASSRQLQAVASLQSNCKTREVSDGWSPHLVVAQVTCDPNNSRRLHKLKEDASDETESACRGSRSIQTMDPPILDVSAGNTSAASRARRSSCDVCSVTRMRRQAG